MLLALTSNTKTTSEALRPCVTVLAQKVAQVTGVGRRRRSGAGRCRRSGWSCSRGRSTQYGISLDEVRQAISSANLRRPKGMIEDSERHWQIQASDQLVTAGRYQPLVITYRNGAPVRLYDVARVLQRGRGPLQLGYFNDEPAVLLVVSRQTQANIIATVDGVTAQLPALRAFLPAGVSLDIASDRSPTIRATLHEAQQTLLIAVGLVILVVLLFLGRLRAAMIPVAAVPVALVGSCGVMYLWGFSLNNLSLMALIVATGLVVDDAIVVLENINRHVESGQTPFAAALAGAKEVGFTLLSMNLSIVAVFVSILFMGGIVERLFREFSITLVSAILISLVVSITLTPMLCARWLVSRDDDRPGPLQVISDRVFGWLRRGYGRTLDWGLAHSPIVLMFFIGIAAFTVHLYIKAPRASCRSRTPASLAASSAATTGCRSRSCSRRSRPSVRP